ncbi:MAG TPA: hypothetical protein VMY37_15505 [Thermoguttaceae bacterium]|nr:hypothetical protein [Thermoguttaceae bacterium]
MIRKATVAAACLGLTLSAFAAPARGIDAAAREQAESIFAVTGARGELLLALENGQLLCMTGK